LPLLDRTGASFPGRLSGIDSIVCASSLELVVSYHSDDFAEAQDAQRFLAAAAALCGAAGHAAADAEESLAGIDPELPGLQTTSEL